MKGPKSYILNWVPITLFLFLIVISLIFSERILSKKNEQAENNSQKLKNNNVDNKLILAPISKYTAGSLKGIESDRTVKVINSDMFKDLISAASVHPR